MKIVSIDQSTSKSGYAIFIDGELEFYGIIRPSKKLNNNNMISMFLKLSQFIKDEKPDLVLFEDVYMKKGNKFNIDTHKKLSNLQGMLMSFLILENIPYEIIHPTTWKNGVIGKKKLSKEETQAYLKTKYGKDFKEDIADAICIGLYFLSTIKTLKNE